MIAAAGLRRAVRRVAQFHEDPAVVGGWRRGLRPVLAWLTPGRRRGLLAAAALYEAFRRPIHEVKSNPDVFDRGGIVEGLILVAIVLAVFYGVYLAAHHFARLPGVVRRRPQITLHALFWLALAVFWVLPQDAGTVRVLLGAFVVMLPVLLWRLGYLLLSGQRGRMAGTTARDHFFYLYPFWGGSKTPYGKGLDYLARSEARTEDALARSQLAGLKLFLLVVCWKGVLMLMDGLLYGDPGSPVTRLLGGANLGLVRLGRLLAGTEQPGLIVAWLSLYAELVRQVLKLAVRGHEVIGLLRLFGFNVFRNTYKPLLAASVVEFWNRYYFYFKELLAEFFFYPTFVRRFKTRPRLRMFAATVMAAGVGNMYYHLLQREGTLLEGDLAGAWWSLSSRTLYCALLALGIYASMQREQRRRGAAAVPASRAVWARRLLGVWTFYGVIHIWGLDTPATFAQRTRFFLSLLGW